MNTKSNPFNDTIGDNWEKREQLRKEYISRINRVIDYISENLDGDLRLEILAKEACFSIYHFHRIFKGMVGETVNDFIRRIRIEKAASLLAGQPGRSITSIALDCGFSGSATFAREFKSRFGVSASAFRESKIRKLKSNIGKTDSNNRKEASYIFPYNLSVNTLNERRIQMSVEVKEMPEMYVAYVRHIGPFNQIKKAWAKLTRWAGPRGFLERKDVVCLELYHDDPDVTEPAKLRTDACITVPKDVKAEGEIGTTTISKGLYAVHHFEGKEDEIIKAWNYICGEWLPESGYQPEDKPSFDIYHCCPDEHPEGKHVFDIYVPVKPL
jgi:AraC family transcriptional regulator